MSLIRKYGTREDLTPQIIMDIVDEYSGSIELINLDQFRAYLTTNLPGAVRTLIEASKGKGISIILNTLLNELPKLMAGETVFLEKYLVHNKNPIIISNVTTTLPVNISLKEESLELLRRVGVRTTVLYYLLITYHMK